jgi:hypothetical protein
MREKPGDKEGLDHRIEAIETELQPLKEKIISLLADY